MDKYDMEIQDQMNYFAFKICNQMLHCVLFFDEHLDDVILKKAIERSMEIEKILKCRFIREEHEACWEQREDIERSVRCDIVKTTSVEKELNDFFVQEIDIERDPLIQVRIFRNLKDCLCIKISHIISDAGGLKQYVSLLARLYTEFVNEGEFSVKCCSPYDRSQNQVLQYIESSAATVLRDKGQSFFRDARPIWSFPSKGYQKSKLKFVIHRISKQCYHTIVKRAKDKGVTMNDVLLTAFCYALQKEEGYPSNQPMLIQVPVDLRRYLVNKSDLPVCNMSGAEYLNTTISDDNFMVALEKIHQYMQSIKENHPGLSSAFALEGLAKLDFEQAMSIMHTSMDQSIRYHVSIPFLSNMGIISDNCKRFGSRIAVDGYLVSPIMYSPGFMLGVSSFGETLTFTVGFSEESIEVEHIQTFIKRIVSELEQAAATLQ